eukprot:7181536-Alexandrium_andersonii.AAC.1
MPGGSWRSAWWATMVVRLIQRLLSAPGRGDGFELRQCTRYRVRSVEMLSLIHISEPTRLALI